jgi:RNA polymerase sigma-70 factor (ECF subfamily)
MAETSASFLERLRDQPDEASWQRLVAMYTPLIHGWLRRQAALAADADDLCQEVLTVVVRRLPDFHHNQRRGAFRHWLRSITINCVRDFWRARRSRPVATGDSDVAGMLDQLADPDSGVSRLWDEEHDRFVTRRLLEQIKPEFKPNTWAAFERVALEGASPDTVAAELGMTVNAVFIAKSRVLSRLRQEGKGLID